MIVQPLFKIGDLVKKRNNFFVIYDQRGCLIPTCPGIVMDIKKVHARSRRSYEVFIEESTYLIDEDELSACVEG